MTSQLTEINYTGKQSTTARSDQAVPQEIRLGCLHRQLVHQRTRFCISRRSHLTEVAHLVSTSTDLVTAGACEREGWLHDPACSPRSGPTRGPLPWLARRGPCSWSSRSKEVEGVTVQSGVGPNEGCISVVEWIPLASTGGRCWGGGGGGSGGGSWCWLAPILLAHRQSTAQAGLSAG
jgi:hypothetical protein